MLSPRKEINQLRTVFELKSNPRNVQPLSHLNLKPQRDPKLMVPLNRIHRLVSNLTLGLCLPLSPIRMKYPSTFQYYKYTHTHTRGVCTWSAPTLPKGWCRYWRKFLGDLRTHSWIVLRQHPSTHARFLTSVGNPNLSKEGVVPPTLEASTEPLPTTGCLNFDTPILLMIKISTPLLECK